jgi:hypothetical protein
LPKMADLRRLPERLWPADAREAFRERVAIMLEHLPETHRERCEVEAARRVIAEWARKGGDA